MQVAATSRGFAVVVDGVSGSVETATVQRFDAVGKKWRRRILWRVVVEGVVVGYEEFAKDGIDAVERRVRRRKR